MKLDIAGGKIEFRRKYTANDTCDVSKGDTDGVLSEAVENDPKVRAGYVSLKTKNVRIMAADFKIHVMGNIKRVGWANVILSSERNYHYENDIIVTETVGNLPTWDGDAEDMWPFYNGFFVSTDKADEANGCSEVIGCAGKHNISFIDAPSMPPSYHTYAAAGLPIGKFILHPMGPKAPLGPVRMTHITGSDRYLACLTIIDKKNNLHVAWSVLWTVKFEATVTASPRNLPQVLVKPTSIVRVGAKHSLQGQNAVLGTRGKQASSTQKRYLSSGLADGLRPNKTTDDAPRHGATEFATAPVRRRSVSF